MPTLPPQLDRTDSDMELKTLPQPQKKEGTLQMSFIIAMPSSASWPSGLNEEEDIPEVNLGVLRLRPSAPVTEVPVMDPTDEGVPRPS